jgi:branched-chain amino acid transport system substrate-binding protein
VAVAWEKWINATGGLNGHPVKVYLDDDQDNPATAQADVQDLINSKKVIAIIVGSDDEISAFDGPAIAAGVPVISGLANFPDWYSKAGLFPTPTGHIPGIQAQVLVGHEFTKATRIVNVNCNVESVCNGVNAILKPVAQALGMSYTAVAISPNQPSYTAQCLQLKNTQPAGGDFDILQNAAPVNVRFIQDCQAQGYNPPYGGSDIGASTIYDSLPNFTYYAPSWAFPSAAQAGPAETYTSVMKQYAPNDNWHLGNAPYTWTGLEALVYALKGAGSNPTRDSVLTGLYSFKNQTLGGLTANPLNYTKNQAVGQSFNPCYFVIGFKGGQVDAPIGLTPKCPTP